MISKLLPSVLAPLVCSNNLSKIFGGCVFRTLLPRYMKILRILLKMAGLQKISV